MKNNLLKWLSLSVGVLVIVVLILVMANTNIRKAGDLPENNILNLAEQNKAENKKAIEISNVTVNKPKPIDESDHILGDKNAPVQIIIYSDFECPFCARFEDTIEKVKSEFENKVMITFRHFPLRFHAQAMPAALASECASEQGKFWEMHDKLFADNVNRNLNIEQFKNDAENLGLDAEKFNQCLASEKYKEKIAKQLEEGTRAGVTGTPTIFINGEILIGAIPFDDFTGQDGKQREGMKNIIQGKLK